VEVMKREEVRTEEGQRSQIYSELPGGCWPVCSSSEQEGSIPYLG